MSQVAVIQLRNKKNPQCVTDHMQVDKTMDIAAMSAYLNSVLLLSSEYTFYYNNVRILDNLQEIMERHDLNEEEVIIIDYLDNQETTEDSSIPCEDVVTGLYFHEETVYARLYNGNLVNLENNKIVRERTSLAAAGDRLLCVEDNFVVDINSEEKIVEISSGKALSLVSIEQVIAVGLSENRILLLKAGEREEIRTDDFYRSLRIDNNALYWVESIDVIVRYDIATKKKSNIYTKNTIVSIEVYGGAVIAATSSGIILKIVGLDVEPHPVNARIINDIVLYGDIIILVSQNSIMTLNADTFAERTCLFLNSQINSVLVSKDKLLVANDTKVSGFLLSRL